MNALADSPCFRWAQKIMYDSIETSDAWLAFNLGMIKSSDTKHPSEAHPTVQHVEKQNGSFLVSVGGTLVQVCSLFCLVCLLTCLISSWLLFSPFAFSYLPIACLFIFSRNMNPQSYKQHQIKRITTPNQKDTSTMMHQMHYGKIAFVIIVLYIAIAAFA